MNAASKFITLCALALAGAASVSAQKNHKPATATTQAADLSGLQNPLVLIGDFKTDYNTFLRYQNVLTGVRVFKGAEAVKLYGKEAAGGAILVQPIDGHRFMNMYILEAGNQAIKDTPRDGVALNGVIIDPAKLVIKRDELSGVEIMTKADANGVQKKYLNIKTTSSAETIQGNR